MEIRGAKLEVVERPGGPETVVFVHGSLSDHRTWKEQLRLLDSRYRGVAYSRRWHWPNQPPKDGEQYRMREHVEDLAALVRSVGAPVHVVGNSWGAFTALVLAMREPSLVRSLVLEEPPVVPLFMRVPPGPLDVLAMLLRSPGPGFTLLKFAAKTLGPAGEAYRQGEDEKAMRTFMAGVLGPVSYRKLSEERLAQARDNRPAHRAENLADGGFEPITENDVRKVSAPALLVCGDRTPAVLLALTDRLQRRLRGVERVTIPDASHVMHEEQPEATARAIGAFLARH